MVRTVGQLMNASVSMETKFRRIEERNIAFRPEANQDSGWVFGHHSGFWERTGREVRPDSAPGPALRTRRPPEAILPAPSSRSEHDRSVSAYDGLRHHTAVYLREFRSLPRSDVAQAACRRWVIGKLPSGPGTRMTVPAGRYERFFQKAYAGRAVRMMAAPIKDVDGLSQTRAMNTKILIII
jgi:hypothetical protein